LLTNSLLPKAGKRRLLLRPPVPGEHVVQLPLLLLVMTAPMARALVTWRGHDELESCRAGSAGAVQQSALLTAAESSAATLRVW
jgi:hypothetical protein